MIDPVFMVMTEFVELKEPETMQLQNRGIELAILGNLKN